MTTEIETIVTQIETLKAEYSDELIWGIRWDVAGLEVGHVFEASHVWDDGEMTDEMLKGTCVIQDTHISRIVGIYPGTPYIVCGYNAGYGEDAGEVILSECEIMAVAN